MQAVTIALDPTQNAKLPRDMLVESCIQAQMEWEIRILCQGSLWPKWSEVCCISPPGDENPAFSVDESVGSRCHRMEGIKGIGRVICTHRLKDWSQRNQWDFIRTVDVLLMFDGPATIIN